MSSDTRTSLIRRIVSRGLDAGEDELPMTCESEHLTPSAAGDKPTASCGTTLLQEFCGPSTGPGIPIFFHVGLGMPKEFKDDHERHEVEAIRCSSKSSCDTTPPALDSGVIPSSSGVPVLESSEHPPDSISETLEETAEPRLSWNANRTRSIDGSGLLGTEHVLKITGAAKSCRVAKGTLPETTRAVYFVKSNQGESTRPLSGANDQAIPLAIEHGYLTGDFLAYLSTVAREIFTPLLDFQLALGLQGDSIATDQSPSVVSGMSKDIPKVGDTLRNDFSTNFIKFGSQVSHATQQVKGDIHVSVPNISTDDTDISNDFEMVSMLEATMENWSRLMASVVEAESLRRVIRKGPMAEIEFWRRRNASLGALCEQMNMPKARFGRDRMVF